MKSDGSAAGIDPGTSTAYYMEPAYNKHPAGLLFDDAILAACKAQVEMQYEDIQSGYVQKFYDRDLPTAWAAHARTAPRKLGKLTRGGVRYHERIVGDCVYSLNHNLVRHGREICKAQNPRCDECVLERCCEYSP